MNRAGRSKLAGRVFPYCRKLDSSLVILAFASTLVWLTTGCASGVLINNNSNTSLNAITFAIIQALPGGVRTKSANQREFYSHYFFPDGAGEDDVSERRARAYAHVIILGDRRPYQTQIRVYRERKFGSGYGRGALDQNLSRELAGRVQEGLAKSREDRNVIDDFRPF